MLAAVLLIIFLLVVIVGVPISFAMGFMTISAFTIGNGAMVIIPQKMFSGVYNFTYMCIPLFILASEIMSRCGLTMSIVKFCDTLVGHIRGGLAHVNILAIEKVKSFVNDITKFDVDFDLVSGRYVIDAKSIMGIFSLDLSKPIDLNIHAENDIDTILAVLKPYIV